MQNVGVKMVLPSLNEFPVYSLPADYSYKDYRTGDREAWVELYASAERYEKIDAQLFGSQFHKDEVELGKRMFFIVHQQQFVGTSVAWYDDKYHVGEQGRVHWVAIRPQFQGRGLARPLLSETLRRLKELGHTKAYLMTSTARIPAISLYLKFGFLPEPESDTELQAWRSISGELRYDLLLP